MKHNDFESVIVEYFDAILGDVIVVKRTTRTKYLEVIERDWIDLVRQSALRHYGNGHQLYQDADGFVKAFTDVLLLTSNVILNTNPSMSKATIDSLELIINNYIIRLCGWASEDNWRIVSEKLDELSRRLFEFATFLKEPNPPKDVYDEHVKRIKISARRFARWFNTSAK
jgi:hypothetical protein